MKYYPVMLGIFRKKQYKDPYEANSIMESKRVFFVAHVATHLFFLMSLNLFSCK